MMLQPHQTYPQTTANEIQEHQPGIHHELQLTHDVQEADGLAPQQRLR
jgi:hypothetical protein